jgi:hypothetical protein
MMRVACCLYGAYLIDRHEREVNVKLIIIIELHLPTVTIRVHSDTIRDERPERGSKSEFSKLHAASSSTKYGQITGEERELRIHHEQPIEDRI